MHCLQVLWVGLSFQISLPRLTDTLDSKGALWKTERSLNYNAVSSFRQSAFLHPEQIHLFVCAALDSRYGVCTGHHTAVTNLLDTALVLSFWSQELVVDEVQSVCCVNTLWRSPRWHAVMEHRAVFQVAFRCPVYSVRGQSPLFAAGELNCDCESAQQRGPWGLQGWQQGWLFPLPGGQSAVAPMLPSASGSWPASLQHQQPCSEDRDPQTDVKNQETIEQPGVREFI